MSSPASTSVKLSDLPALAGSELGASEWLRIDQPTVNSFARTTHDEQWIHCDVARAIDGPFGGTIAHGYLTLSLCSHFLAQVLHVTDAEMAINYGLDRVRFPAPVPVGSSLQGNAHLQSVTEVANGLQIVVRWTVEADGQSRPVCVADVVMRFIAE